jgi:hypothetical protein
LAYDFLAGRLSHERRLRFESKLASTERGRVSLEFARALLQVHKASHRPSSYPRYWAAGIAAALILALLPAWLALRVSRLSTELDQLRAQSQVTKPSVSITAPIESAFIVIPGRSRSPADSQRLELSPHTTGIRLELVLPPGATAGEYVVTISKTNQVYSTSVTATAKTVVVSAPAELFTTGDYTATLRRFAAGEQPPDLATYSFRLIRK